eukprot:195856-Chlamydomonas_euryale.AAC.1
MLEERLGMLRERLGVLRERLGVLRAPWRAEREPWRAERAPRSAAALDHGRSRSAYDADLPPPPPLLCVRVVNSARDPVESGPTLRALTLRYGIGVNSVCNPALLLSPHSSLPCHCPPSVWQPASTNLTPWNCKSNWMARKCKRDRTLEPESM